MAKHASLTAEPREMLGKKVRALRRKGILPATVYGHNITPTSIQVNAHEMTLVLRDAGRTQLIDLAIGGTKSRPVFIKQTTIDAKRNVLLHVEFYQANLLEKMHTRIPVHFVGESPAVKEGGIFINTLDHVEIESLPDDVPQGGIEIDLALISEINGTLHVSDLVAPAGVEILTPGDEIIAKVDAPLSEEALEELIAAPETPVAEAEVEGAETEAAPDA